MSKIYEHIKEIDDNLQNEEAELEEIEILLDKKEKKIIDKIPFRIFILFILLIASLYTGYYLAGLFFNKSNNSKVKNLQPLPEVNKKENLNKESIIEFATISQNKKELENKLKEFLNTNREDNIINNNIALMLCELGNYKEALNYAEKLIIKEPNNPYYWNTFGIVLTYLNLFDDAEKSFKKAISLKSDEGVFYYNLGNLYEREGKINLAKEQYLNYLSKGDKYNIINEKAIKKKLSRGL